MDQHEPPRPSPARTWTVAEASRRLEEVLRLAQEEGPQVILTQDGTGFAVSSRAPRMQAPAEPGSLRDVLVNSPLRDLDFEFEGLRGPVRDVDFE